MTSSLLRLCPVLLRLCPVLLRLCPVAPMLLVGFATTAHAGDLYIGARAGFLSPLISARDQFSSTWEHEFDHAFSGGLFVGNYLGSGFRGELAVDVLNFDTRLATDRSASNPFQGTMTGDARSVAFTASLWRDLPGIGPITPYLGLGAGLARTNSEHVLDFRVFEGDDLSPVGLVGAGGRFDLNDRFTADFGYRFISVINTREEQTLLGGFNYGNGHYTTHQFSAGLSYRFGDGHADDGHAAALYGPVYVGGFLGGAWTPDAHIGVDMSEGGETVFSNPSTSFGVVAGAELAPYLRGEVEVSFLRSQPDRTRVTDPIDPDQPADGRFDQTFVLANLWQDFGHGPLTAYVGGGLGFAHVDYDIPNFSYLAGSLSYDGSAGVFAGQFGAGVRYQAKPNVTIDVGYRMRGAIGAVLTDAVAVGGPAPENARTTLYSHTLQVGATYGFGVPADDAMPVALGNGHYISAAVGAAFNAVGELNENQNHPLFFDPPVSLSLAYGHRLTDNLRAEVELGALLFDGGGETRDDGPDEPLVQINGGLHQLSLMTNYWADFDLGLVQPYAGGGVGLALVSTDFNWEDPGIAGLITHDTEWAPGARPSARPGSTGPADRKPLS